MFKYFDVNVIRLGNEYKCVYLKRVVREDGLCFGKDDFNDDKIGDRWRSNLCRAKSTVLSLALCNDWEYYVTFTLDSNKYDRYNLPKFIKDLSQFIRDLRKKGYDISYLLIPEMHRDCAWHMHGLMNGLPVNELVNFQLGKHPVDLVYSSYKNWVRYENKFGYNTVDVVRSKSAVSRYILKYISKGMTESSLPAGAKLYYCSQGLKRPEIIYQGCSDVIYGDVDFENDFMASKWCSKEEVFNIIDNLY